MDIRPFPPVMFWFVELLFPEFVFLVVVVFPEFMLLVLLCVTLLVWSPWTSLNTPLLALVLLAPSKNGIVCLRDARVNV